MVPECFKRPRRVSGLLEHSEASWRATVHLDGKHAELPVALAHLLSRPPIAAEREFYRDWLLWGGPRDTTQGRQRQLAGLMRDLMDIRKDETTRMPAKEDLPGAWRNTYFLDSLKAIALQLREA